MNDRAEDHPTQGTTLDQRRALIAAYERDGNMSAAMREVGIRSPRTAYLWWRRYQQSGDEGLVSRSRARKTQRTVRDNVAARVIELRRTHPEWGRRRIAREIRDQHGRAVVSPAGVEAVLRRGGLWAPEKRSAMAPAATEVPVFLRPEVAGLDALLPLVVSGIETSLSCHAATSVAILGGDVWSRLGSDRLAWSRLLSDPAIGPLLLRSRVELGRSLMNTGQWREAARILEETQGWLRQAPPEARERSEFDSRLGISLRRSDAWLETYQYLGIVSREQSPAIARGYLSSALSAIRSSSRRLVPLNPGLVEGNLERDMARHLLLGEGSSDTEIAQHLDRARGALEATGDRAMLAATEMVGVDLESRRAQRLRDGDRTAWISTIENLEVALEQALAVFETLDSPMLHANFLTDASHLAVIHGLGLDRRRVHQAAAYCIAFGYGGQARRLRDLPGIDRVLPSDVLHQLSRLAQKTESRAAHPDRPRGDAW